jgi:hypothetical protein
MKFGSLSSGDRNQTKKYCLVSDDLENTAVLRSLFTKTPGSKVKLLNSPSNKVNEKDMR